MIRVKLANRYGSVEIEDQETSIDSSHSCVSVAQALEHGCKALKNIEARDDSTNSVVEENTEKDS